MYLPFNHTVIDIVLETTTSTILELCDVCKVLLEPVNVSVSLCSDSAMDSRRCSREVPLSSRETREIHQIRLPTSTTTLMLCLWSRCAKFLTLSSTPLDCCQVCNVRIRSFRLWICSTCSFDCFRRLSSSRWSAMMTSWGPSKMPLVLKIDQEWRLELCALLWISFDSLPEDC